MVVLSLSKKSHEKWSHLTTQEKKETDAKLVIVHIYVCMHVRTCVCVCKVETYRYVLQYELATRTAAVDL